MNSVTQYIVQQIWPPVSAHRLGDRLPEYLAERVRDELGMGEEPIELEKAGSGANTLIRRWPTSARGRLFVRAWPWNPGKRNAREHSKADKLISATGLKTPEVLWVDDSFATMKRWRLEAAIETEAPGAPFNPRLASHRERLDTIAGELATMHAEPSAQWGKPWRPNDDLADPRRFWAGRLAKFEERIHPGSSELTSPQVRNGLDQLRRRLDLLEISWPVLIHGDVNPSHLFIGDEDAITWIDFGTVQYGFPEQDLAAARNKLTGPQDFDRFLSVYEERWGGEREISRKAIETFAILELWERLNSRIKKQLHRRRKRADEAGTEQRLARLAAEQRKTEERLLRVISSAT